MNAKQISELAEVSESRAYRFLRGEGFGAKRAARLEEKSGINLRFWLFPEHYKQGDVVVPPQPQEPRQSTTPP